MRHLSHSVALLSALACLLAGSALPIQAERLIFQRGDALYAAGADGKDARRLFTIGMPLEVVWAVSGDGRRIAWYAPLAGKGGARTASLKVRPIAVYVADLSGQRKKRLFSTDNLRDRQGRPVTQIGVGTVATAATRDGGGLFENWTPDSLAWSADGKSLYLSCTLQSARGGRATFVADSATGAVVVDAAQRWKSIAPMTQVDARGPLLAGVGLAYQPGEAAQAPEPASRFYPLLVTNLAEGKTTSLLPSAFSGRSRPLYAAALAPALAPDGKSLAFATVGAGLWHVDVQGKTYRRLTRQPGDDTPRWSMDGKRLLFLSARSEVNDLYEITLAAPAKRRIVLPKVERFFVVPD